MATVARTGTSFTARKPRSKYNAEASRDNDGNYFASKKEKMFFESLKKRLAEGEIENLEFQPIFPIVINDVKVGRYRADFRFTDLREDPPRVRVIDVKGLDTRDSIFRRKVVQALYGITVEIA